MEGESDPAKRSRGCLNVRGKVERNTVPVYEAKVEAMVIISQKKQALKAANITSDGHVYWSVGQGLTKEEWDAWWCGGSKKMENGRAKDTTWGKRKKYSMQDATPSRNQ
jgi:hypothetical protein